ncbi:MAG: ribonuclease [Ilumatobacteraceae bacterium]|nr:ribonuclease [Ilumatobacteraceae bacterium]
MPAVKSSDSGGGPTTVAALAILAVSLVTSSNSSPSTPSADAEPTPSTRSPSTTKSGLLGRIDLFQQRRRPLAFLVGVIKRFGEDRAGQLAALIAYYGFFSLFPAMLALVTVLGFVLDGNDSLRHDIANSALAQFPVIGDSIGSTIGSPLSGNVFALVFGAAAALWAGLGAMQTAQDAMNQVWNVPRTSFPKFVPKRLRSLAMLLVIVVGLAASTFVSQFGLNGASPVVGRIGLFIATLAVDIAIYLVAYRVLTVARTTWRRVLPGALVAGTAYTVLQVVGTAYVTHTLKGAQKTYGTFAAVIGLLSWIYLMAQITMFGAEVNIVASEGEWPRSLFSTRDPLPASAAR